MKRRYLFVMALVGLMWTACSSDRSGNANDTIALDSPAVSDSLAIKTTDADSLGIDTVNLDTTKK
ncbi:hypothetical protein [Pedobacter xixiisoli]|nr:hypothetical protein [Pedobacter xixiisoli]